MSDLIDRQTAISAIQKAYGDTEGGEDKKAVWRNVGLTNAIHIMQDLPSAQPERTQFADKDHVWINGKQYISLQRFQKAVKEAQTEIIRCKDCKYSDENWRRVSVRWLPCMDMRTGSNWFCGSAEGKNVEKD